jgi:hypothetical protein
MTDNGVTKRNRTNNNVQNTMQKKFKLRNWIKTKLSNAGEIPFLSFLTIYPFCAYIYYYLYYNAKHMFLHITKRNRTERTNNNVQNTMQKTKH